MMSRRHGTKPTLALWMLVAVADVAIVVAAVGPLLVLSVLAGLVTLGIGGRTLWSLQHRNAPPAEAVRRRA